MEDSGTGASDKSITAIPVRYRGHHCRSRLEARWMVFFDRSGIEFQYEPQGYRLPNGTCYLPDFYFPKFLTWAEVKPVRFTDSERSKCAAVAAGLKELFLILDGPPAFREYLGAAWDCGQVDQHPYSLDWRHGRRERFFALSGQTTETDFSAEYRAAVHASIAERFDGIAYPEPGEEPFNPDPKDILKAWGLLQ